jgi:DNA-binding CsgD family transcriptional regulator
MRAAVADVLDNASGRADIEASALAEGEAVLALVREDHSAALTALDAALDLGARWRRGTPWWVGLRVLLRAVDDVTGGADHVASAAANPVGYACVLYAQAVRAGRAGQVDEALTAFAAADAAMPQGWKRHLCRRLVSEGAPSAGWRDPGAWAREALDFFDALGIVSIANACKRVMRKAGVPVPRAGRGTANVPAAVAALGVTSREMDVLALVAEGLSNAEIGKRLFLSPRTIETHVASLCRKTQVGGRVQLVALAARLLAEATAT